MATIIQPFDFQTLFLSIFAGSSFIFVALCLLMFTFLAAKFRMPSPVFGGLILLFAVIMAQWFYWLYIFAMVVGGLIIFFNVKRIKIGRAHV